MWLYVCVCVSVCICMYVCLYVFMCKCIYLCHACIRVWSLCVSHVHVCVCVCTPTSRKPRGRGQRWCFDYRKCFVWYFLAPFLSLLASFSSWKRSPHHCARLFLWAGLSMKDTSQSTCMFCTMSPGFRMPCPHKQHSGHHVSHTHAWAVRQATWQASLHSSSASISRALPFLRVLHKVLGNLCYEKGTSFLLQFDFFLKIECI